MSQSISLVFFFMIHHGADLNIVISISKDFMVLLERPGSDDDVLFLVPVTAVLIFGTQSVRLPVYSFFFLLIDL